QKTSGRTNGDESVLTLWALQGLGATLPGRRDPARLGQARPRVARPGGTDVMSRDIDDTCLTTSLHLNTNAGGRRRGATRTPLAIAAFRSQQPMQMSVSP